MKRYVLACLTSAVLCFAASSPVHADDKVLELWPTSQWSVDEFDTKCRLFRRYGAGKDRTTLWIERGGLGAAYNLTLIGRPFRHPFGSQMSIQFAPEPEYKRAYLTAKSSQGQPVISLFGTLFTPTPAEIESDNAAIHDDQETVDYGTVAYTSTGTYDRDAYAERMRAITHLHLGGALMDPVTLRTGPLEKPFTMLYDCVADLDQHITQNMEGAASLATPVELERWAGIIQRSYPAQMLRDEEEGRIAVRLTIGKEGRPGYCEVLSVVGPTSFNDTVCLLMLRHATFEPARDMNGKPIVSRYSTTVTFKLED